MGQYVADALFLVIQVNLLIGIRFIGSYLGGVHRIKIIKTVPAQSINPPIACNAIEPRCDSGFFRIKHRRLIPKRRHRILHDLFGCPRIRAKPNQIALEPRSKIIKKLGKSCLVPV